MTTSAEHTILPPAAGDELTVLVELLTRNAPVTVSTDDGSVTLPEPVRALLTDLVRALAAGNAVTVEPHRTVLTTQEAADLLGITRPTLVRLLESGRIPFTKPGRHRRIELADVLEFRQRERTRRRQVLVAMAQEATPDPAGVTGFSSTR